MANKPRTHKDEVRPFTVFLLTGGLVTGVTLIGMQSYLLGVVIAVAGCVAALLAALTSKILDQM